MMLNGVRNTWHQLFPTKSHLPSQWTHHWILKTHTNNRVKYTFSCLKNSEMDTQRNSGDDTSYVIRLEKAESESLWILQVLWFNIVFPADRTSGAYTVCGEKSEHCTVDVAVAGLVLSSRKHISSDSAAEFTVCLQRNSFVCRTMAKPPTHTTSLSRSCLLSSLSFLTFLQPHCTVG